MIKEFKVVCIKDDLDNPLRIEFTANGFEASKKVGLYINGSLLASVIVDKSGNVNELNIAIPAKFLVDFASLGGFGQQLENKSIFLKTGSIGHMVAGNIKFEATYF